MKDYNKFYDEIISEELYRGLLGFGLFAEKIPPVFTSENFYNYIKKNNSGFPKKDFDYIRYENMRNINVPRLLAIPHPFGYANLVKSLVDNWDKIKAYISKKTTNQPYKVSKVHLRKLKNTNALFQMNYKGYEDESEQDVNLILGMRYRVNADISNCFPSIYSHSIPWALMGKPKAKSSSNNTKLWENQIDFYLRNTKNQETNGILIGPHSSNLLSELVLIAVDKELLAKKYKFSRHIDDYVCYTPTKEKADRFLIDLSTELKKFELNLNHKKSKISELPHAFIEQWVRKLKHHRFKSYKAEDNKRYLSVKETEIFLDLAVDLMHKSEDNSSVLNYALQIISRKKLDRRASQYLVKRIHHLCFLFPYLIQILDKHLFQAFNISKREIKSISNTMIELGLQNKTYEACSYSLFFAIKYGFRLSNRRILDESLKSEDCIFMVLGYLYGNENEMDLKDVRKKAIELYKNDFDRYWLFIYEVLKTQDFDGELKSLKKKKVSFIKKEYR